MKKLKILFVLLAGFIAGSLQAQTISLTSPNTTIGYVAGTATPTPELVTIVGTNLSVGITVSVAATANIQICATSDGIFGIDPITLPSTGGTMYVRVKPDLAAGNTGGSGANRKVTATSGSTTASKTYTVSITAPPYTTTVSTPSNSALSYEVGYGPSAESTFTVEGANLLTDITVTTGSNLEISTTSGAGFVGSTGSIMLTKDGSGTVATTTIYTRLKAGLNLGSTSANANRKVTIANLEVEEKTV